MKQDNTIVHGKKLTEQVPAAERQLRRWRRPLKPIRLLPMLPMLPMLVLLVLLAIGLAGLTLSGCADNKDKDTAVKIKVLLDWTPNTNHTGLYVARDLGYFRDEGLDVSILQPSEGGVERIVAAGSADFGVSYQEAVTLARSESVPVVSIAAIIQHNSSGFASLKEKGITSPKDFEGKKYGGWGSDIEKATITYLMREAGADPDKAQIMTTGEADFFQASQRGDIDFAWIFEGWAGIEAKLKGIELDYIDLGQEAAVFDYYTPVLITREAMIEEEADRVERFARAVRKGYEYAIAHPEAAAEILLAAVPELSGDLVRESQAFLSPRYQAEASRWGYQQRTVWERYMQWLLDNQFIQEAVDVDKAFTNRFIEP